MTSCARAARRLKRRLDAQENARRHGRISCRKIRRRGATLTQQSSTTNSPRLTRRRWSTDSVSCWSVDHHPLGTEEQKKRYVRKSSRRTNSGARLFRARRRLDSAGLQTRAVEEGDYFIVNGQKVWTSDAHQADMLFLLVAHESGGAQAQGDQLRAGRYAQSGVTVRPLVQITATRILTSFFEDVKVPKKNLMGEKTRMQVAITTLCLSARNRRRTRLMGRSRTGRARQKASRATHTAWTHQRAQRLSASHRGAVSATPAPATDAAAQRLARDRRARAEAMHQRAQSQDEQIRDGDARPYSQMEFHSPHATPTASVIGCSRHARSRSPAAPAKSSTTLSARECSVAKASPLLNSNNAKGGQVVALLF